MARSPSPGPSPGSSSARCPRRTLEAVEAVKRAVPRKAWPQKINVATRTFQALRMAVNQELESLDALLSALPRLLKVGGRAAVISFHSLEDRKVKEAFRELVGRLQVPARASGVRLRRPGRLLPGDAQGRGPLGRGDFRQPPCPQRAPARGGEDSMSRSKPVSRGSPSGASVAGVLLHLLPAVLLFALFAGVAILHVTSRVMVVDMGYRLSKAEAEERSLTRENDRLKLELATLKNPARLEKLAREKLGMSMPSGPLVTSLPLTAIGCRLRDVGMKRVCHE